MSKQSAYSVLAKYYDKLLNEYCDYQKWSQYLHSAIKTTGGTKGVDLACGTGKMTVLLKKLGYSVVGMDSSVQMLNVARQLSNCTYVHCDMQNFAVGNKVNFVTCVNDGINYIPHNQLVNVCSKVYDALADNGVFVFDISSQYKLTYVLANNVFYYDNEDCTCLWANKLYSDKVVMDITLFEQVGQLYERSDEQHTQYIYTQQQIVDTLKACRFGSISVCDCYTTNKPTDKTHRLTFTAYKQH